MSRQQYRFDISSQVPYRADLFHVAPANEAAWNLVAAWPNWPHPVVCLVGPPGSGKTHLARIWCDAAKAVLVDGAELGEGTVAALRQQPFVAVDDADRCADHAALFHLYNHAISSDGALLLTAASAPSAWPIDLQDLRSRLSGVPTAAIDVPDDDLLEAIIRKLFRDRQIDVPDSVVAYLTKRIERSYANVHRVVESLDGEVWARGEPVSLAKARSLLDRLGYLDRTPAP